MSPVDVETWNALRAAGISQLELEAQRSLSFQAASPPRRRTSQKTINELLDMENNVVVEILSDEEFTALERWWPENLSNFDLRFSVDGTNVDWSTPPCRECDASGRSYSLSIRNRNKNKVAAAQGSRPTGSLEY